MWGGEPSSCVQPTFIIAPKSEPRRSVSSVCADMQKPNPAPKWGQIRHLVGDKSGTLTQGTEPRGITQGHINGSSSDDLHSQKENRFSERSPLESQPQSCKPFFGGE